MTVNIEHKQQLVDFIRAEFHPEFQPEDELMPVLDSVGLVKMLMFMEAELGMPVDIDALDATALETVDSLISTVAA